MGTYLLQAIYTGLKKLNVSDDHIHYEFFGRGSSLLKNESRENKGLIGDLDNQEAVMVRFEKSNKEVMWDPMRPSNDFQLLNIEASIRNLLLWGL